MSQSVAFETELTKRMGNEKVYVDEVYLDHARYPETDMEEALVDYLQKRVAKWQPDLVVPLVSPACVFVAQHRERLFPSTPILYAGMDKRRLPAGALEKNATFVGNGLDLPGFAEDMLQLAPDTTNIVCVIGASPVERYWTREFQSEFARFTNRVSFTWLNDLPFDQMLERVKRLPPRSFVFVILMLRDAAGVAHNSQDVLKQIREAANAPVNSIFENQLGLGIVGGRLYSHQAEGVAAARIAFRILRGEPASSFPSVIMEPVGPQYDWRELKRWRIPERSLPLGSIVQFRELTIWDRYRGWILGCIAVFAVEGAIIASLLMNRIKRRRAEETLRNIAAGVSAKTGETFFQSLAKHISEALQVEYAYVCEVCEPGCCGRTVCCARTIASYVNGAAAENVEYDLAGTPCEQVLRRGMAAYAHGVQKLFPEDVVLVELGAESYLGVCLKDSVGKVLGLMAVLSRRPLVNVENAESLLNILAARTSAELERKQAEEDLRISEERYREVVESQTDLVCRFLHDGTLTFVNEAYCCFFGCPGEKMIGRKFYEFLPENAHAAATAFVEMLIRERRPLTAEYEVVLPDGTIGWQHWVDYPILGPNGGIREFQGIGRDITDRKRAEAANVKLTHATRLAMVGELTGMVVHDLSQPLSAILCNARAAELMLQTSNPPALKEIPDILAGIRNDTQRASETVHRMRTLLRQRQLELKPLDFGELVEEVLHIVSGEAARRRIHIKIELADQSPPINGDRVHLQQVLLNLILNGMDAMATTSESKRRLLIRAAKKADEIEVTVSDTGQGIPLERLPRIFDSFFTTKKEGLGLGLSICKWIIEAHRGRILAENNANGGATFRFTLPTSNVAA